MIDREQAIRAARNVLADGVEAIVDAILALPDPDREEWVALAEEADRAWKIAVEDRHVPFNAAYTLLEEARAEIIQLRPVVEAARTVERAIVAHELSSVSSRTWPAVAEANRALRSALAAHDKGEPTPCPHCGATMRSLCGRCGWPLDGRLSERGPMPITDEIVERARNAYLAFHNAREVEDRTFKGAIRAALDAALNGGE